MSYGLGTTGQRLISCSRLAPDQVQCQVSHSLLFGWLPLTTTYFSLQDVTIESTICDNTPRGGVRFCHQVTLLGDGLKPDLGIYRTTQALPEMRTPLSTATVQDQFQHFIHDRGQDTLTFEITGNWSTYLRTGGVGMLLAIVAWGFWDVQWPSAKISPLALDGEEAD